MASQLYLSKLFAYIKAIQVFQKNLQAELVYVSDSNLAKRKEKNIYRYGRNQVDCKDKADGCMHMGIQHESPELLLYESASILQRKKDLQRSLQGNLSSFLVSSSSTCRKSNCLGHSV